MVGLAHQLNFGLPHYLAYIVFDVLTAFASAGEPKELPNCLTTCYICLSFPSWHCSCSVTLSALLVEGLPYEYCILCGC